MRSLTGAIVVASLFTSMAVAQTRPASSASSSDPATSDVQTGSLYAGPRVWIGNLNGAVTIGGQVEEAFTKPGAYGPGLIEGGVGIDWYSWSYDYPLGLGKIQ